MSPDELDLFARFGIALLLGLVIGVQRGWVLRDEEGGRRVAGVRTFTLISLFGGVSALLSLNLSEMILVVAFIGLTAVVTAAYLTSQRMRMDMSITSAITSLLTFCFGALAVLDFVALAAAAAVVTAVILDFKPEMHGFLKRLREQELDAGLMLLLISVVMLPILPNQGMGPWQAINPYEVWWMVVLIASISFVGYFAVKIGGAEKGILFTSLFAGLSSSTALTLHYSRLSRDNHGISPLLASGVLAACGTMFPRVLFVCSVINWELGRLLIWPMVTMTLLTYAPAVTIWLRQSRAEIEQPDLKQNPLELKSAVFFGAVLLSIMLLSHALREWFGDSGLYLLAAISGITDVDAITLTLSRQSAGGLSIGTAAFAIVIAACVNSLVKAGMTLTIGDRRLAERVAIPLGVAVSGGLLVAWWVG